MPIPNGTYETTLVSRPALSAILDITEGHVAKLENSGIVVKRERGQYELAASVVNYIRFLRGSKGIQDDDDVIDIKRENALLIRAKRTMIDLEIKEKSGELLNAAQVEVEFEKYINRVKAVLDTIHITCKRMLPELETATIQVIQKAVLDARNAIADSKSYEQQ